jgi:DNA-binding transcriptional regulator YdaS (Cro superfamily)
MCFQLRMIDALKRAEQTAGSVVALARALGVTSQAISQWHKRHVPAERVLDVERATGVPRHELRPDLYPPPAEGRAA